MVLIDDRQSGYWAEIIRNHAVIHMTPPRIYRGLKVLLRYAEYKKLSDVPKSHENIDEWKRFAGFKQIK